jgi:hypothetical protein
VHTNPIILTFCSLLYYKELTEHLRRYKIEKAFAEKFIDKDEEIKMATFKGRVPPVFHVEDGSNKRAVSARPSFYEVQMNLLGPVKKYNKFIVNKWHVLVMLERNKALVRFRKHFVEKNENEDHDDKSKPDEEKTGVVQKIKNMCSCCRKEKQQIVTV